MPTDIPQDGGTIKPGESLTAPEWEAYWTPPTGKYRNLQEYGFAIAVVMVMYQRGWWTAADLPPDDDLARLIRCLQRERKSLPRMRTSFERIPAATLRAQIERMHRWPMWMIRELAP